MAKGNGTPAKPRAASAKTADAPLQTVKEAVHQLQQTKANTETVAIITDIYRRFLTHKEPRKVVHALNELQDAEALEKYVWGAHGAVLGAKDVPQDQQHAWVVTVLMLVAHRLRSTTTPSEMATAWRFANDDAEAWRAFMAILADAFIAQGATIVWSLRDTAALVQFLIHAFASLEVDVVASEVLKLVSLPMWSVGLSKAQREVEFTENVKLSRHWKKLMGDSEANNGEDEPATKKRRKEEQGDEHKKPKAKVSSHEKHFFVALLDGFLVTISKLNKKTGEDDDKLRYTALMLSLLTDLLSQLPTRRFLLAVLRRKHVAARVRVSPLIKWWLESRSGVETKALTEQIERLDRALHYSIDVHTGKSLTTLQEQKEATTRKIQTLQLAAFQEKYRETPLETLAVMPVAGIVNRTSFYEQLVAIAQSDRKGIEELATHLGLFVDANESKALSTEMLVQCFVEEYSSLPYPAEQTGSTLLPTELEIWSDASYDEDASPVYGTGADVLYPVLSLPKLGLQYLSASDLLSRAVALARIDAAAAVRADLEAAIRPMNAIRSLARNGETVFRGFSPMAAPLETAFSIMKVAKPAIGETHPSSVIAQFDIELDTRHDAAVFDTYQRREVVYLVTIRPTKDEAAEAMGFASEEQPAAELSGHFAEDYGVLYVRCAQVLEVQDENGNVIRDDDDSAKGGRGRKRTIQVALDGAQYKKDLEDGQLGAYEYVNLLVRRDPRVNNFRAVLDSLTSALKKPLCDVSGGVLPTWLYDLVLGYGDPTSGCFESILKRKLQAKVSIPMHHAFEDAEHAASCCSSDNQHPLKIVNANNDKEELNAKDASGPYVYEYDVSTNNAVIKVHHKGAISAPSPGTRLTREQAQLVLRGSAEGLTVGTGAHGHGKSTALAHLIQNLYQSSRADEKVLVVARSTVILDALLDQVKSLPYVDEGSLVRLGAAISTQDQTNFSCQGRVDFLLQRRLQLLQEVDAAAKWMERQDATKYAGLSSSASYSCENALFFYQYYMKPLVDDAVKIEQVKDSTLHAYYVERMGSEAKTKDELLGFVARLEAVFTELRRLQAYELLQLPAQRRDVYLMQHARVVAMTARHAALQFERLSHLKLKWTSVLVEDATQINQVDTIIPLLLATSNGAHNLKRVVLVGDEKDQPTVSQVPKALTTYANFHTSLLTRLLRLGVPSITFNEKMAVGKEKKTPQKKKTPGKKK